MPHIPRRYASTQGIPPGLPALPQQPRRSQKPPVPYHGEAPGEEPPAAGRRRMIERISMRNFEMPTERVYAILMGQQLRKVTTDEFTRELLHAQARNAQG